MDVWKVVIVCVCQGIFAGVFSVSVSCGSLVPLFCHRSNLRGGGKRREEEEEREGRRRKEKGGENVLLS